MKRLLIYLNTYKKECVFAPLFKMLEAIFELFVPLVMASMIDKGIGNADHNYILKMCFVLLALATVGLVCAVTAQYFAAKAAVGDAAGRENASDAIKNIDDAIKSVSAQRSDLGAAQNRLGHTVKNLTTTKENLAEANSRIRDVDMAEEMMSFTKSNILSQAATAMLAQANQMPQGVLQLLQ